MLIQYILIATILLIIIRQIYLLKDGKLNKRQFILWLLVWLVAGIVIIFPDITSYFAIKAGVTRGVDLVVYISIILLFYICFRLLIRIEKMEKNITDFVRSVALKDKDEE